MKKGIITAVLSISMICAAVNPTEGLAKDNYQDNLVKVASIDVSSYPKLDNKTIIEANRRQARNRRSIRVERGASLFSSPYFPKQEPDDQQKAKFFANVSADFDARGLDDKDFDWAGVFGKDIDGNKNKAQIVLEQQYENGKSTGTTFGLKVDGKGNYKWIDGYGKSVKLPLYSSDLKPYRYEVSLDKNVSNHVKLLTVEINESGKSSYKFGRPDPTSGEVIGNITLKLTIQQLASTKFTSKWNTDVGEADRPKVEGSFLAGGKDDDENYGIFPFPKNDKERTIIRKGMSNVDTGVYSIFGQKSLETTPKVDVEDPDSDSADTYTLDRNKHRISYKDKTYKYDLKYDVINGGRLTMTEILPVTFDANGGKFASVTEPNAEQKIVKEVEFDGNLTDKAENPTKENESFKGWSLKEDGDPLSDVDFNKAIKNIKEAKTFYAIYGKASAKISYLDLDGKAIDDKFKLDETEYPADKEGKAGTVVDKNEYTEDTAPKFTGYKFNRVELNPTDAKYAFENQATIKIYYEKLPDVIPANPDGSNPDSVPADYVRVEFVPTKKGTIDGDKVFFVNPKKEVTIPVNNPTAKATYKFKEWKMGENAKGEKYTPSTPKMFTQDATITATYEETENIIPYDPSVPDPMARPEGYVRVSFKADKGLELTEEKAYYVKKNAGITLGNDELVKPKYKEETGYKFKEWDKEDKTKIEETDIVVTAKATKLDNVIPEKDGEGNPNTKPEGYKEVTFVIKDDDKTKGSIEGVYKFYVNPREYVTINPPATKANTGFEFGAWDKNTLNNIQYKKDTTITGSFNGLKDLIPKTKPDGTENKKPAGYKKVEFVIDPEKGGKIADKEVAIYYVNPAKEVTVPQPKTAADTGYEFEKWDQDTVTAKKYDQDTTVKGNFKKLDDIIPSTDDEGKQNAKPEGYVTVTFEKGDHGEITKGQTVYYVNPKADPAKTLGDSLIKKPTAKAETGYKFTGWNFADTKAILSDITVIAQYEEIADVIPKTKDDESEKPEGYITVKFSTEANGKIKGTKSTEKVLFINPNKAVSLQDQAPEVNPNTGFEFSTWDTQIEKNIQYKNGDVIKAKYNAIGDVIPQEKTDGTDKPEGYLTVTFVKGDHGELDGKTVYYVKPNKEVTVPAPSVKASTGYEFKNWDQKLTQTFAQDTKITAEYKTLDDIIPQGKTDGSDKPAGYFTVTFKPDANGSLSGTTVYYVKPNVDIDLTNTANNITKNPNQGYTEKGGSWDPEFKTEKISGDKTYTFSFKELDDVIPEKDKNGNKNEKPAGYVTVKLIPTEKAKDKNVKYYFVNPTKEVTIRETPVGDEETDSNNITYTYQFIGWKTTFGTIASWNDGNIKGKFTQDTEITALYKTSVQAEKLQEAPRPKKNVTTPIGTTPEAGDLIGNKDKQPEGTTYTYTDGSPNVDKGGDVIAKVLVKYPNGKTVVVEVPISVTTDIIEDHDGSAKHPDNYVKVIVDTTDKAVENTRFKRTFWVNPAKVVKLPIVNPSGSGNYVFKKWQIGNEEYKLDEGKQFTAKETTITASYEKEYPDIIPQSGTGKPENVPESYVEVIVDTGEKAESRTSSTYWVNPNKELVIPQAWWKVQEGYKFDKWTMSQDGEENPDFKLNEAHKYTKKTTIVAKYKECGQCPNPDKDPTPDPNPGGSGGECPEPTPDPQPQPGPGGSGGETPTPTPEPQPGPGGSGGETPTPRPDPEPQPGPGGSGGEIPVPSPQPEPQPGPGGSGGEIPVPTPQPEPQPGPGGSGGDIPIPKPSPEPNPGVETPLPSPDGHENPSRAEEKPGLKPVPVPRPNQDSNPSQATGDKEEKEVAKEANEEGKANSTPKSKNPTRTNKNVKTGIETNLAFYLSMIGASVAGIVASKKKKK
ncbi:InlB B-repeat-containing protein [Anaerococcus tetradius]|nr:InlB B-repeat-containing protein [Anaerococcus tetradius]